MEFRKAFAFAVILGGIFSSCSSGGSSDGAFVLLETSVPQGAIWEINRPIEFRFSRKVDINTVDLSTIQISALPQATAGGAVGGLVTGLFYIKPLADTDPLNGTIVVFQPSCPPPLTSAGSANNLNTGGGLEPANNIAGPIYSLQVVSVSTTTGPAVKSLEGKKLAQGVSRTFTTALNTSPYVDPLPTPISVASVENFPAGFTIPLNLTSDPMDPIVISLDQPIWPGSYNSSSTVGSIKMRYDTNPGGSASYTGIIPITVTLNNCGIGGTTFSIVPQGVLPPGRKVVIIIDKNLKDLTEATNLNDITLPVTGTVTVASKATPQWDMFLEEFIDTTNFDSTSSSSFLPFASWGDGVIQAAQPLPGLSEDPTIDITISSVVLVDTTESSLIAISTVDSSTISVPIIGGVIKTHNLTIESGGQLIGSGPNALKILASGAVNVKNGGLISVRGGDSPTAAASDYPTTNADVPVPGGVGQCGGGNGGDGSPITLFSDSKGSDGFGAFNLSGGGGKGGHSAIGSNIPTNVRAGGGGGGNWGQEASLVNLVTAPGTYVCTGSPPSACDCPFQTSSATNATPTQGKGTNLIGEPGTAGTSTASDAFTGGLIPAGGLAGPAIFGDGNPSGINDFVGIGVSPGTPNVALFGELGSFQGGPGGGAGGDGIPALGSFPPASGWDFAVNDYPGGSGGGGGGILIIRALGTVTIDGQLSADGGDGGGGDILNAVNRIGGGGGGGAGGMISVMSASSVVLGSVAGTSVNIHALGGDRGYGNLFNCYVPGQFGNSKQNTATNRGGAGGMGVIQIHVPRTAAGAIDTGGLVVNANNVSSLPSNGIMAEAGNVAITPNAYLLVPDFSKKSLVRSNWYYTGWANLGVTGSKPLYYFFDQSANDAAATDIPSGGLGTVSLNPSKDFSLASGTGGITVSSDNTVVVQNQAFRDLVASNPNILINDDIEFGANRYTILAATLTESDSVTLSTDPDDGPVTATSTWTVLRKFFEITTPGSDQVLPSGWAVKVDLEGRDETSDGSGVPSGTALGDPDDVNTHRFIRFNVTFEFTGSITASTPRPQVKFLKIPYNF